MFGWDWDFEIIDEKIMHDEVIVKGKLTCRSNGKTIVKMQFGNKDLIYKTETRNDENGKPITEIKYGKEQPKKFKSETALSIGNDLKAAATDCLKKCAAEIGIASDIYNKEDFREIKVALETDVEDLFKAFKAEFELKKELIPAHDFKEIESCVELDFDAKKLKTYKRYFSYLKTL